MPSAVTIMAAKGSALKSQLADLASPLAANDGGNVHGDLIASIANADKAVWKALSSPKSIENWLTTNVMDR